MVPGMLGGSPRPGVFYSFDNDVEALARVGTRVLVTLTEEWEPDVEAIKAHGITSYYLPIPDMEPPTIEEAEKFCMLVDECNAEGKPVVYHCRAGKGRTGTMLAAQLIWRGADAEAAVVEARERNSMWIESESQYDWLMEFGEHCKNRPARAN